MTVTRCNQIRNELALHPTTNDSELQSHLAQCNACAAYARRHEALNTMLQVELRWQTPPMLTEQLLSLVAIAPAEIERVQRAPFSPPKGWYITLIYLLTIIAVGISTAVVWQLFGLVIAEIGVQDIWAQLVAVPAQWLTQLTHTLPESRYLINFLLKVRDQLVWLLLAAVLWAALDTWHPHLNLRRRQQA